MKVKELVEKLQEYIEIVCIFDQHTLFVDKIDEILFKCQIIRCIW